MSIASRNDTTSGKHVCDRRNEQPPVTPLVGVVEETILAPRFLVFVKNRIVSLYLFELMSFIPDLVGKAKKDGGEKNKRKASKGFRCPGVTNLKLVYAIEDPDAV